jgi:hypothetical protein
MDVFVLDLVPSPNALLQHGSPILSPLNVISNPRKHIAGGGTAGIRLMKKILLKHSLYSGHATVQFCIHIITLSFTQPLERLLTW